MLGLQRLQLPQQTVILGVRDLGVVEDVVAVVVIVDRPTQALGAGRGLPDQACSLRPERALVRASTRCRRRFSASGDMRWRRSSRTMPRELAREALCGLQHPVQDLRISRLTPDLGKEGQPRGLEVRHRAEGEGPGLHQVGHAEEDISARRGTPIALEDIHLAGLEPATAGRPDDGWAVESGPRRGDHTKLQNQRLQGRLRPIRGFLCIGVIAGAGRPDRPKQDAFVDGPVIVHLVLVVVSRGTPEAGLALVIRPFALKELVRRLSLTPPLPVIVSGENRPAADDQDDPEGICIHSRSRLLKVRNSSLISWTSPFVT